MSKLSDEVIEEFIRTRYPEMSAVAKAIAEELLSLRRENRWIPVTEWILHSWIPILVVWGNGVTMAYWNPDVKNWQEYPDGDFDIGEEVTHCRYTPELPKAPSEEV